MLNQHDDDNALILLPLKDCGPMDEDIPLTPTPRKVGGILLCDDILGMVGELVVDVRRQTTYKNEHKMSNLGNMRFFAQKKNGDCYRMKKGVGAKMTRYNRGTCDYASAIRSARGAPLYAIPAILIAQHGGNRGKNGEYWSKAKRKMIVKRDMGKYMISPHRDAWRENWKDGGDTERSRGWYLNPALDDQYNGEWAGLLY